MNKTKIILLSAFILFVVVSPCNANDIRSTGIMYNDTLPPQRLSSYTSSKAQEKHVETDAAFPGGEQGWKVFLGQNLRPDMPVVKGAPAGTYQVLVQFIVDGTGKVTDINPLTAYGYGMEEEVVRVIKRSPRWKPAVQDGKFVNAYRKQPVTFTVEEKKKRRLF